MINAPWHWFNELGAIGYWNWEYDLKEETAKMTAGLSGQKVNTYPLQAEGQFNVNNEYSFN